MVTASLMRGQNSLTSLTRDLLPLAPVSLQLEVPARLQGDYRLEVRGVDLTSMEGDLFQHSVPLTVTKPSQLVGLRLDQSIFLPSQNVAFLVWVAQTDLTPYTGAIDVELVGPGGAVMQRWSHRGAGLQQLSYKLAQKTPLGKWSLRARAGDGSASANFEVINWAAGQVDVEVDLAKEVSMEAGIQQIVASVSANCSRTGLSIRGQLSVNATLLDTKSRRVLGEVVVSQPEWEEINMRRSFAYTTDQVEKARLVSIMFSWCFLKSQSTYFQSPSEAKVAARGEGRRSTTKLPDWESSNQAQLCKFTFLAPTTPAHSPQTKSCFCAASVSQTST